MFCTKYRLLQFLKAFILLCFTGICPHKYSYWGKNVNNRINQRRVLFQTMYGCLPFIICRWRPTRPWLSKPVVLLMASAGFISGPSKLSLLAKFDMFNVDAIWFAFALKFVSMSLRRFISFSVLWSTEGSNKKLQAIIRITPLRN